MELFDKLYDEHENVKVRFIGFKLKIPVMILVLFTRICFLVNL